MKNKIKLISTIMAGASLCFIGPVAFAHYFRDMVHVTIYNYVGYDIETKASDKCGFFAASNFDNKIIHPGDRIDGYINWDQGENGSSDCYYNYTTLDIHFYIQGNQALYYQYRGGTITSKTGGGWISHDENLINWWQIYQLPVPLNQIQILSDPVNEGPLGPYNNAPIGVDNLRHPPTELSISFSYR